MYIHNLDPVIFNLGFLSLRWYSVAYILGIIIGWWYGKKILSQICLNNNINFKISLFDDYISYVIISIILGGRIGYILFYNLEFYLLNPLEVFFIWKGGMSFHGGFIGVILAVKIFSTNARADFLEVIDFVAPLVPIGLGLGRLGNFINNELWGKTTDFFLGFLVEGVVRHPTQLYEAVLEGLILFMILWIYSLEKRRRGMVAAAFLFYYGLFRIFIEFFRIPDSHIGYLYSDWLTLGQLLSLPMLILGLWIIITHRLKED